MKVIDVQIQLIKPYLNLKCEEHIWAIDKSAPIPQPLEGDIYQCILDASKKGILEYYCMKNPFINIYSNPIEFEIKDEEYTQTKHVQWRFGQHPTLF